MAISSTGFPTPALQAFASAYFLIASSIITGLLTRRFPTSRQEISHLKLVTIAVFSDSWLFIFSTMIILFGVGTNQSEYTCSLAILCCISFYAVSKLLISFFLLEKVYIVSNIHPAPRLSLPIYRVCLLGNLGYLIIIALAIVGRNSTFDDEGICHIGLKIYVTVPLICYDIGLNLLLTFSFILPIRRSEFVNPRLRAVAMRTLAASVASLSTSTVNIIIIAAFQGHQQGWLCLLCCTTDVVVNASVLFWVSSRDQNRMELQAGMKAGTAPIEILINRPGGLRPRESIKDEEGLGPFDRKDTRKPSAAGSTATEAYLFPQPGVIMPRHDVEWAATSRRASSRFGSSFSSDLPLTIPEDRKDEGQEISFDAFLNEGPPSPIFGQEGFSWDDNPDKQQSWAKKHLERVLFKEDRVKRRPSLAPTVPSLSELPEEAKIPKNPTPPITSTPRTPPSRITQLRDEIVLTPLPSLGTADDRISSESSVSGKGSTSS